jgi:hypothetical protein
MPYVAQSPRPATSDRAEPGFIENTLKEDENQVCRAGTIKSVKAPLNLGPAGDQRHLIRNQIRRPNLGLGS